MVDPMLIISGAAAAYSLFGPGKEAPTKVQEISKAREKEANAILKELTPREKRLEAKKFAKAIIRKNIPPEKRGEILKDRAELKRLVAG